MRARSDFNSVMILVMFMIAPMTADMVTVANGLSNQATQSSLKGVTTLTDQAAIVG